MKWIIPIGGKGTRTQALGEFKPFIEIAGHKIMVWFLISIKRNIFPNDFFVFITTPYFSEKFQVQEEIKRIFQSLKIKNKFEVFSLEQEYPGVSGALYAVRSILETDDPVIVINPDQYLDFILPREIPSKTGYLTVYAEFSHKSGYVDIQKGKITKFVEKNNISNLGSAGVFIISESRALLRAIRSQFKDGLMTNGEYYLGPAFNYLIKDGFDISPLPVKVKYDLGNISDIAYFVQTPLAKALSQFL